MPTTRPTHRNTLALAALLLSSIGVCQAQALTYTFVQGGYAEGAMVTGSFSGTDSNGDGQLISFHGEIADFNLQFSGNSLVPAFSHSIVNLTGLTYEIGTPFIADGNLQPFGEGVTSSTGPGVGYGYFAFSSGYRVFVNGGSTSQVSSTSQLLAVSAIPEPPAILLTSVGCLFLIGVASAKRAA